MSIKVEFNLDDAALEADIAQRMGEYNARTDTPVDLTAFAIKEASYALERMRGSAKSAVVAKMAQIDDAAAIAEVAVLVDAKIAEKPQPIVEPAPIAPAVEVQP